MTNSTEFDIGEDELGSDNLLRRSIEDAIANDRLITVGEYNTFMSSIGALVPAYVSYASFSNSELVLSFGLSHGFSFPIFEIRSSAQNTRLTSS